MARLQNVNRGFSLTEVLLAVGILSVGMIFIAGVFPAGIHFATIATERSIAAVAADEAFAKIKLYAIGDPEDLNDDIKLDELEEDELTDFNDTDIFPAMDEVESDEFAYPSVSAVNILQRQYCWSALCRLTEEYDDVNNPNPPVQVTTFVCRKVSPNLKYPDPDGSGTVDWPMPVKVEVSSVGGSDNKLEINDSDQITFINDGYTIVDDRTGRLYRVLERYPDPDDDTILLDRDWDDSPPGGFPKAVWVIPPPTGGGRYPCIAIYQKVIRFSPF